jgi:hypothetical protein
MSDAHVVYENTLDNNTWTVKVVRVRPYEGTLTITKVASSEEIHSQPVTLAYDAAFGPDVDDVADWQEIAIKVVDGHEQPA